MTEEEVFVIGKVNLNPVGSNKTPFIEIVLDTAGGRAEGEIVLLKQVASDDNNYYTDKIPSVTCKCGVVNYKHDIYCSMCGKKLKK